MLRSTAMGGSERTVRRRLASGRESPVATRVGIAGRDQGTRTRENGALPATSVEVITICSNPSPVLKKVLDLAFR